MNFLVGFEKWVKTLPIKFESCAFAFDAILVSFMVRHFFWLFFSNRYSTENRQKDVAFFFVVLAIASPEFKKWVNSRSNTLLTRVKILWYDIAKLGRGVVCQTLGGARSRKTSSEETT